MYPKYTIHNDFLIILKKSINNFTINRAFMEKMDAAKSAVSRV